MSQQTDAAIAAPAATVAASRFDATATFAVLRSAVGVGTWISPKASYRTFGLGVMDDTPANVLVARLFAVRELLFGLGLKHPEILKRLKAYRKAQTEAVLAHPDPREEA